LAALTGFGLGLLLTLAVPLSQRRPPPINQPTNQPFFQLAQLQVDLDVALRPASAGDVPDELAALRRNALAASHRRPAPLKNLARHVNGALDAVALVEMPAYQARRNVQRMADVPPLRPTPSRGN